jgi:hypothetical protein
MNSKLSSLFPTLLACKWGCEFASWIQSPITPSPDQPELRAVPIDNEQAKSKGGNAGRARSFAQFILSGQSEILRCAQDDSEGLCRSSTRKSLRFSTCSADLFFRSAARPRWTRKSRGPKNQVRATLPRPEFLLILGSHKAVSAQNHGERARDDSTGALFRSLFSPPFRTRAEKFGKGLRSYSSYMEQISTLTRSSLGTHG